MAESGKESESHVLDDCTAVEDGEGPDSFVEVKKTGAPISISDSIRSNSSSTSLKDQCLREAPPSFRARRSSFLLDYLGKKLGGNFCYEPEDMIRELEEESVDGPTHQCTLSPATQRMLRKCFKDIDPEKIVDYHVHLVGHGDGGSGCRINQVMKQWWRPLHRIKSAVFMFASQVSDMEGGDLQYLSRLVRLVKHFAPLSVVDNPVPHLEEGRLPSRTSSLPASLSSLPSCQYVHGKCCLLAFDAFHEKDGTRNDSKTTFYVPNDYSLQLGAEFPEYFYPVGSVNPYRQDAVMELERCASRGVTIIKWLPNSMGINPDDKECDTFYKKLKELDMALLVHVGEEHSVTAAFIDNKLGNPLLLRRPLSFGVKVIAAHCASEGYAVDFEASSPRSVPCFDLLMRLMNEKQYDELLFADISAICGFKRVGFLNPLLSATHLHHRLVYGSDYPVPAINLVVHTSKMQKLGLITAEECQCLNELYHYNPLLFDFASKRVLRGPNGEAFPPDVFKEHPLLPPHREVGTPV